MRARRSRIRTTAALTIAVFVLLATAVSAEELTPSQALKLLQDGNVRFVDGTRTYPSLDASRREETAANGQFPFATVIGCSDSRVPIEHLFDVGVGDIFPIRVAGNVADIDEIGSIEYGIEHLHTPVLVVLGHTSCGAVTAVARGDEVGPNIEALVDNIIPAVDAAKERYGDAFSAQLVDEAVRLNVWQTIADLFDGSEAAVELVESGELDVIGAVYHLDTGRVEWLGEHPQQRQLIAAAEEKHAAEAEPARGKDITPSQALALLQQGNARYVSGTQISTTADAARREETAANGQFPFATVIGCSDSRVPIERLFDAGVGDIFPIRVAGNVADIDEIGSIEYGIEHLHTPVLVVLGHTSCGAVTAVARGDEVGPNIAALVDNIVPAVEEAKLRVGSAFSSRLVDEAVRLNVYQTIEDLFGGSEAAVELVEEGELDVVGAVYHLDTGEVEWIGEHPQQRQLLASAGHGTPVVEADGGSSVPASAIVASLASVLILIVAYIVFVSRKTGLKSLRTRGRLVIAATSMLVALGIPEVITIVTQARGTLEPSFPAVLLLLVVPVVAALIFGTAVASSTSNAFTGHLQMLKEKYGGARTAG